MEDVLKNKVSPFVSGDLAFQERLHTFLMTYHNGKAEDRLRAIRSLYIELNYFIDKDKSIIKDRLIELNHYFVGLKRGSDSLTENFLNLSESIMCYLLEIAHKNNLIYNTNREVNNGRNRN